MSLAEIYNALKGMCSICYEHECEITLPICKDQLCYGCMTKYIKEVVHNSWGLNETKMKCPVCLDDMPKKTWMRYADKETIARYEAYNKPFRPISIFCAFCNSEVPVSSPPPLEESEKQKIMSSILEIVKKKADEGSDTYILIKRCLENLPTEKVPSISRIYNEILYGIEGRQTNKDKEDSPPNKRRKIQISDQTLQTVLSQLISLETDGDCWRDLQHKYVQMFPKLKCHGCQHDLCFKCGNEWHSSLSCEETTRRRMSLESSESVATFEWQLRNSKRCPGCSALINREDGCNKMDCLNCGYEFCWVCEEKWSKDCAFFRCGSVTEQESIAEKPSTATALVHREVGVPDVDRVERSVTNFLTQQIIAVRTISTGTPHHTHPNGTQGSTNGTIPTQKERVVEDEEEEESDNDEEEEEELAPQATEIASSTSNATHPKNRAPSIPSNRTSHQNMKKKTNFVKQFVNFFDVKELKNVHNL